MRPRKTEHERKQIREFNTLIKQYSPDAVKEIYKIATRAIDMNTRLKACIWIAEKLVGSNYSVCADDSNSSIDHNVNIRLIPTGTVYVPNERDEKEIRDAENEEIECEKEDQEEWNLNDFDDDWGNDDIYDP